MRFGAHIGTISVTVLEGVVVISQNISSYFTQNDHIATKYFLKYLSHP